MIDRELMQQALEALNRSDYLGWQLNIPIIKALRERLAQPEQEPVAWKDRTYGNLHHQDFGNSIPLYTTPQPNTIANSEAIPEQISEPVAWRDHVEQRLLTWRQSFVNKSGDQLALDDFMDKESLDDLIDYVCDEYTIPPRREWPVQEPVAWLQIGLGPLHDGDVIARTVKPKEWNPEWWRFEPLYTTPPRRQWRGLSDDDLEDLLGFHCDIYGEMNEVDAKKFAADIEKRLEEKNA